MIDFLFSIPLWLLGVHPQCLADGYWGRRALDCAAICFAAHEPDLWRSYYAAALVQTAMLLYGLIAALTAVGAWQRYGQVSDVVSGEATAITSLWRDLGGYPQSLRGTTEDILRGYTEQIIREA